MDAALEALADKLGVKPGASVRLVDVSDHDVLALVAGRAEQVESEPDVASDVVFYQVAKAADLDRVAGLRTALSRSGALWVLWPRGGKSLRESEVQEAGLAAGLVDVKVARISETISGLKFVYRLRDR